MNQAEDRLKYLVQATFGTESGAQLMDELVLMYCTSKFDENPYAMARKVGEADLVMFLKSIVDEQ